MTLKKYTILSNQPAPERMVEIFTLSQIIEFCDFSIDQLKDWFKDYRYDAEVPQGEIFYKKSINIEIEHPDGTTKSVEIPVDGTSFEKEQTDMEKKMKNGEFLIRGEMEWTSGRWNSFSIELDEYEVFDHSKIKAKGYCGMVTNYTYDGEDFINNEDWALSDGYINLEVFFLLNDVLYEMNFEEIINSLEENDIDTGSLEPEIIMLHLKELFIPKLNRKKMSDLSDIFKETADWTEEYIDNLIDENKYGDGSEDGDELILKIAAHPNTNPTWLEDFVLSGAHPIIVALHVVKNSSVNSDLLNQTWEENEKWWNNDEISSTILGHPNCPESLKQDDGENEMLELKDIKMSEEKDIYDLTPFNMDYEDEDHIDDCRDGKFYIEKAKSGIESFEVEFASFGQARCFYRYIWDDAKLTQIIVENGDLFEDDEIDEGLDDETWNEAIEHEYFPDIVEKAIEDGECEVKVLFEK